MKRLLLRYLFCCYPWLEFVFVRKCTMIFAAFFATVIWYHESNYHLITFIAFSFLRWEAYAMGNQMFIILVCLSIVSTLYIVRALCFSHFSSLLVDLQQVVLCFLHSQWVNITICLLRLKLVFCRLMCPCHSSCR